MYCIDMYVLYYICIIYIYMYVYIATVEVSHWINGHQFVMMPQITGIFMRV